MSIAALMAVDVIFRSQSVAKPLARNSIASLYCSPPSCLASTLTGSTPSLCTTSPTRRRLNRLQRRRSFSSIFCSNTDSAENSSTGAFRVCYCGYGFNCYSRDKLRANLLLKQYYLEVDLRHVGLYNDELAHAIQDRPTDILPLVRSSRSAGHFAY